VSENCKEFVNLSRLAEEPIPFFAFGQQLLLERFAASFQFVATQWLSSLRSYGGEKYPVRERTVMPACFGRIAILRNVSSRIGFEG
jgi:hypothetical protein